MIEVRRIYTCACSPTSTTAPTSSTSSTRTSTSGPCRSPTPPRPTVLTLHGRLDLEHVRQTLPLYPHLPLVSISDHQRAALDGIDSTGPPPSTTASTCGTTPPTATMAAISRSWAASARRRAQRPPSRSPAATGGPCKSPPRSIPRPRLLSRRIEPLFTSGHRLFLANSTEPQARLLRGGRRHGLSQRLARTLRAGDDRVDGRRHPGHRAATRLVPEILSTASPDSSATTSTRWSEPSVRLDEIDPEACRQHAQRFNSATMCAAYNHIYENIRTSSTSLLTATPNRHREPLRGRSEGRQ